MKIGIYNANLHTMGGGEKHIGVVAEALSKTHDVEFLCSYEIDKEILSQKLNLDLSRVKIRAFNAGHDDPVFAGASKEYDLFINSTYWSRLKSLCEKSVIMIFFPWITPHAYPIWFKRIIYKVLASTIYRNKEKLGIQILDKFYNSQVKFFHVNNYISTYDLVIANSKYTQGWIKKELQVDSEILYPPIDIDQFQPGEKENIILSVGRFFIHSHNKKQLEMIKFFKKMYSANSEIKEVEYHLCGGLDKDKLSVAYIEKCKKEAKGYPIFIHENISFPELKKLYAKAKVFWHASGFGENPNWNPDKFEHFGMTTVEAMSAGAIPVVIGYGGQLEIVTNGVNGFLWYKERELINQTLEILNDEQKRITMMENAIRDSKKYSRENTIVSLHEILKKICVEF